MKSKYLQILFLIIACACTWLVNPEQILGEDQIKCPTNMVYIQGGTFSLGEDNSDFYEEKPVDDVTVSSFCIDQHEVTNAEFRKFIQDTGYLTIAERPLSVEQFPNLSEAQRKPGSLVFKPPESGVEQVAYLSWWKWVKGANWQHPYGVDSDIEGKDNHPVVHISYLDALAYAKWAGKELPTESQWEYAARGGLKKQKYTWGNEYSATKANTWQGIFPFANLKIDGYLGTAPVGSFPPNGYNLVDMAGNVWEWTKDYYQVTRDNMTNQTDPQGAEIGYDPKKPYEIGTHVIKGGSYLCAPNYCSRYRPSARESQSPDTGTTHIGFRLVVNFSNYHRNS